MDYQVVVIGGGPIGAVAARCAAEAGARVLLAERRARPADPACCAGLISPRTLPTLGASERSVLGTIRAVEAHSPGGRTLSLRADEVKAVVVDRSALERELLDLAANAGVEVEMGTAARIESEGRIGLRASRGAECIVSARVTIGADGPRSGVARSVGLTPPEHVLRAVQVTVEAPGEPVDRVGVHLGEATAPGFFGWSIPIGPDRVRVGLAVAGDVDPTPYLARLLDRCVRGGRVVSRTGGLIPISPTPCTVSGSTLLVGDAAGQVKPLSGGGLYTGGTCARLAGRFAAEAASDDAPAERLRRYEAAWREQVGREIAFGRSMRRVLARIPEENVDRIFASLDGSGLLATLAEVADIDRFHRIVGDLAGRPSLWKEFVALAPLIAPAGATSPPGTPGVAPDSSRLL